MQSVNLSESDETELVRLIKKCKPGNLPSKVFEAVATIAVYPAIEFVLLRKTELGIETLLLPRSSEDPVWPNMLHTPGTVLRPTDLSLDHAIDRLFSDELGGVETSMPRFTGFNLNKYRRGNALVIEYWLEVYNEPKIGTFYSSVKLPANFIPEQKPLLSRAVNAFEAFHSRVNV